MIKGLLSVGEAIYRGGLFGIQRAYGTRLLKTHSLFPAQVVSVGNLTWGGTGKTPMVLQLAKSLSAGGRKVAVLTRGYGADEADLLSQRLYPIPVLIDPDRVAAGERAIKEFGADLLILDDGYQQWRLKKDVEILMVNAEAPFGNGHLIPKGTLREPISAAGRANIIVAKKFGESASQLKDLEKQLRAVNKEAPIFYARYKPEGLMQWPSGEKVPFAALQQRKVCSLAGIAHPKQFEKTLLEVGISAAIRCRMPDHHPYTAGEMIRLFSRCRSHGISHLVTTAKDAVRLPQLLVKSLGSGLNGMNIFVLEAALEFEPDESQLLHRINSLLAR
ncbi:MAG: tetraacyldisaccharide 4'-kinase [Candidatus Omnitrophica bacterium]|nr:tetraacyldisaccharide 4'-kinase [Candidatus Omnitrophota bacterium]